MKKSRKIILVLLLSIVLIVNIPLYSNAEFSFGDLINSVDSFENAGGDVSNKEAGLQGISKSVSNILLTIALGVTLISAIAMGINFTIQSVEDKAKIKESMVPWLIGIFISFGAYGIWKVTMSVFYGLR